MPLSILTFQLKFTQLHLLLNPHMKPLRIASGILLILAALWLPPLIWIEVLPQGWYDRPDTHWWTVPMVLTMACSSLGLIVLAIYFFSTSTD